QTTNPAYELQLPYGVYTAARMNAELGTTYDIHKLVNWCFEVGPLRQWGAIVGKWGEYDCSGLIGEVNGSNDYAFAMNTFEQIGALVPLARYDERFARAIGKWVLNAANASRLFYSGFLPDQNQDNRAWTLEYDPQSSIAYEALRQINSGQSPYGTGDAIRGGWAKTNLALYGSSHVGVLGGIIDTTNVEGILKLDLLATDYFHASAYPTYLFYNPYSVEKSVELKVGDGYHDIYDAVSNSFLLRNVTGNTSLPIPAEGAVLIVITPTGGAITYNLDKMSVNGVVVDYHRSSQVVQNYPPRLKGLAAAPTKILLGKLATLYATAVDRDGDPITYFWNTTQGAIVGAGQEVAWVAPYSTGAYSISCLVTDGRGGSDSASVTITVVDVIPSTPVITSFFARPAKIDLGGTSKLTCVAFDSSGAQLRYRWSSIAGSLSSGDSVVLWTAPRAEGNYYIKCMVENLQGGQTTDSVAVVVRDFSKSQTGNLVAYYAFNGNANDMSGNSHHATVQNAIPVSDRQGKSNSAYYFNGSDAFMQVANQTDLNFQNAITVSFWMRIDAFYDREVYPISHGNWENRWKVSITNRKLRWTVKTTNGIKDLDSKTELAANTYYHVVALYSGSDFEVYLNGELDAFSSWSGMILPTTIDLTIGQVLPNNAGYNFIGVLDEIRIYNYALSVPEIVKLYDVITSVEQHEGGAVPTDLSLFQNFPNPFNGQTTIRFIIPSGSEMQPVSVRVYDVLGREVASLIEGPLPPGIRTVQWESGSLPSGVYSYRLRLGGHMLVRKMIVLK
ncbi:MAG: T9SS type A sorting domain-containing protein, partial [Ignavibacteriales bacterium]|nr:T9SS type A sorting domain-containing protein [Ignavibacteriales bacterium]